MAKDREYTQSLDADGNVQLVSRRSSSTPVEYALILRHRKDADSGWRTVISADNSHEREGVDEHHMHRYSEGNDQGDPEPLPFAVDGTNDAMSKIIDWFADTWPALIAHADA